METKGPLMLYAFGFERIVVVVADLYFVDPEPNPGQEGPEQGVRLEVRALERGSVPGSVYCAQPITVGEPIWRGDLLESVDHSGSFDRTHHHPRFRGWEPGVRRFVDELTADPLGWTAARLGDLEGMLADARWPADAVGATDADDLRTTVPEIMATIERTLERVRAGELARPPDVLVDGGARVSWL